MVTARFLVPLAVVVCAAVVPAASARVQPAARITATCTAAEQAANQAALAAYVKRMARDRKAYFKRHRDKAHRKAFVKRQQTRLKALQTAASRPDTPPPPPPPFQSGHYAGKTSQNENFAFDVSPDGSTIMNLTSGQINESCNGFDLFGGNLDDPGAVTSISSDGSFTIHRDSTGQFDDGTAYEDHLTITGHLSGSSATGTLLDNTSFTTDDGPVSCTSNPQTWSASRTG